jgi:microsomal dipeptidase-like Zn-dependent dipeptidase
MGEEHVAMGPNIVVHDKERAEDIYKKSSIEFADLWLEGLEDVDIRSVATEGLIERGYNEDTVEMLMGGNILRLLRGVIC